LGKLKTEITRFVTKVFALCLGLILSFPAQATHNRAGEITYEQIGPLTIRVTITTYTKTSSFQADRDSLQLFWGDGTSSQLLRSNGAGDLFPNDIKRNYYIGEHTYPGRASYILSMTDPNRIGNIINVNDPNSIKVPFHIETSFTFLNTQFQGFNSSAILLQPPIDYACLGQTFIHNANAYDPDGDSLSYELIVPLQAVGEEVPNYNFPDRLIPGPNNKLTLDPVTGDLVWRSPQRLGEYNVAFKIHEYRQGVLINSIIRDMQILVEDCMNQPPEIETIDEICVIAGEVLSFTVTATDPDDPAQTLELTALGGPFETQISPASLTPEGGYRDQPVSALFEWQTQCEHISDNPYSVVFKAVDDFNDTTGLATLKTVRIKVVGPPPENLNTEMSGNQTTVTWDKPYRCEVTEDEYFRGFTVWRKETSSPFLPDTCMPGLEGRGYTPIAYSVKDFEGDRYQYIDNTTSLGSSYCYRVTATFAKLSAAGNLFNLVQSLPSNESCAGLILNKPYLTKVSILETSSDAGQVQVEWTRPSPEELDTLALLGPYRFELRRGLGFDPAVFTSVPGASFTSSTFKGLIDTSFLDELELNTLDEVYSYEVQFYSMNRLVSTSPKASTVRLSTTPNDHQVLLSWEAATPWENYAHEIYRMAPGETDFRLIATSNTNSYTDRGLINGEEYCYYVMTEGTYGFAKLPDPLFNLSQITCEIPEDAVPPCIPILTVQNSCDNTDLSSGGVFINRLYWNLDLINCEAPDDVDGFRIYYKPHRDTSFILLTDIDDSGTTTYDHGSPFGIAGCYAVTSLDSLGNESDTSNVFCVENCPFYQLPNVFTPNGDGSNDVFVPFPYKFIDHIDLKIFNRWGQLVYETTDPDIQWTGVNFAGDDLAQGVYHYTCTVFEATGVNSVSQNSNVLRGFIELVRN